eukprot:10187432-Prorocentrum_lima.AAC.1
MDVAARADLEQVIPEGVSRIRHLSMKFLGEMVMKMNTKISLFVLKQLTKHDSKALPDGHLGRAQRPPLLAQEA